MKRFAATTRIAFAMAMWTATVLLGLRIGGVLDDGVSERMGARTRLAETIAVTCSQFASRDDFQGIDICLRALAHRNPSVLSAACIPRDGDAMIAGDGHAERWSTIADAASSTNIAVPVMRGGESFAEVQICFAEPTAAIGSGILAMPSVRVTVLATLANLIGFSFLLRRCFRNLDPSRAVPMRVRSALDTLVEGVVVLDKSMRINLANAAFSNWIGQSHEDLQGQSFGKLNWERSEHDDITIEQMVDDLDDVDSLIVLLSDTAISGDGHGERLRLRRGAEVLTLRPNASAILDGDGKCQGYLVSLNDISDLEKKQRELEFFATRDPLTECLNRRSFFDRAQPIWNRALDDASPLSVLMVDIDHFKSVNDNYGHAIGDQVLSGVAKTLLAGVGAGDLVCRFGGEEFCVVLPGRSGVQAAALAQEIRESIAALAFGSLRVTASFGVCDTTAGVASLETMLDRADQGLYNAKRGGRNRVETFAQSPDEAEIILETVQSLSANVREGATQITAEKENFAKPLAARG